MVFKNIFGTRWGIIGVGAVIGVLAPLLQWWGNPKNMGICVACFERDMAGAVGLHRLGVVKAGGIGVNGVVAVFIGLAFCCLVGLTIRRQA